MGQVYRSKIDWWIGLVLIALAGLVPACVLLAVTAWTSDQVQSWVYLGCAIVLSALLIGLAFPVRYLVQRSDLTIRFGLARVRIPIAEIEEIAPSRLAWSAPALSMQRLRVRYGAGRSVLISPADPSAFLAALRQADPQLLVTAEGALHLSRAPKT